MSPLSLGDSVVNTMYQDRSDVIWIVLVTQVSVFLTLLSLAKSYRPIVSKSRSSLSGSRRKTDALTCHFDHFSR
jgi:putative effector of murein hydrolase LrgA (UPF0299 family)